jgi:transcriptional regulator with XRE-family HTH domain
MKLDDWLKAEDSTSAAFARLSGIGDRQLVHKYRHGERFPSPENLRRIREATNGAVTATILSISTRAPRHPAWFRKP